MKNKTGKIVIEQNANVWPHELRMAKVLAQTGYNVKFIPAHNSICSADAYINNTLFEFKSPEGSTIKCVENNLQKAIRRQSKNVVIDSSRLRNIQDRSVQNYLIKRFQYKRGIKRIIFINKAGLVLDIF